MKNDTRHRMTWGIRLRMFVRRGEVTALVPFDDAVPRAAELQEKFPATLVFSG